MGNKEQMMNVAINCIGYERTGRITASCVTNKLCKTCLNCCHCENNICSKDLFEHTLITLD